MTAGNCFTSVAADTENSWTYVGNSNSVVLDMNRLSTSKGILLFRPDNGVTTSDSDRQTINLKKAGIPTGVGTISATSIAPEMITGVSSSMEYMKQGASSWTSITGNTISVAPGNYCVRVSGAYTTKLVIMQVQTALNALGYKTGTPDGILGKQTKAAIRKYQKVNGLKVTGTVNTRLHFMRTFVLTVENVILTMPQQCFLSVPNPKNLFEFPYVRGLQTYR